MRFTTTRLVMALTAVTVVVWSGVAVGANGDAIRAGRATSATKQTTLNTIQSSGNGFQVNLAGASTGAAIRANATGSGSGVFATASNPNAVAVKAVQNSASQGTGAAANFGGVQNNGVLANTANANAFGIRAQNNAASAGTGAAGFFDGKANTGVSATGGTLGVDSNVAASGAVGIRSTAGADSNDAFQATTANAVGDGFQATTSGGAAFGVFSINTGGGAGVVSSTNGATGVSVSSNGGTGLSVSNGSATNAAVLARNGTAGGTAGNFNGDTAIRVRCDGQTFCDGLNAVITGDTDGNGTATDDGNDPIIAQSDDSNDSATISTTSCATSDEFTCEALEAFGFVDINGNARVTGNLNVVGACCGPVIDNPIDPANSYLRHTSVSSDQMKNMYDGVVTTDRGGFATVRMPAWFPAMNKSFRYQLTVMGRSFAQAIVWKEIAKGGRTFQIRTNQPNVKVSWQVTGVRNDAYARAHPFKVIQSKGEHAGEYLHPELFGHPRATPLGQDGPTLAKDTSAKMLRAQAALQKLIQRKVAQALREYRQAQEASRR